MTPEEAIKVLREVDADSKASKGDYYADQFAWHGAGEIADAVEQMAAEIARLREERHNGTELGHLLRSAQVTIPQELKALDPQCRKYAAGWNDCLHNVKAMLAGKITVNQQTGAIKVMKEGL